jgi:proline-specific peptidase
MADPAERLVELEDGVSLNVVEVGTGHPLILLHGGPGLDHHELHPWLDPLAGAGLRLLYVDMRGQGRSDRVDPASLSIGGFAQDVDRLARALDLPEFSLYGHSFGAIVSLAHALERGTASRYVISSGAASSEAVMADVEREIEAFEPAAMREQIKRSWDAEPHARTVADVREIMESQMPFHFWEMGDAYRAFTEKDETVYSPEVLAHFASNGYGGFEWVDHLRWISKPMLVLTGRYDRTCTVARSEEIHAEVAGSRLVIVEKAAHMTHVEQPKAVMDAIRGWLTEQGAIGHEPEAAS